MDENLNWHTKTVLEKVSKNLKKNNFSVIVAENREDANKKILEIINSKDSVGVGGSMSIKELGLVELLKKRGQKIIQHQPGTPLEESLNIRRQALTSDVYMSSPNALTMDGALIFCDGVGNRVSGMIFGPKKVIAIAGYNKIVENEDSGWQRISNIASPANAKRLKLNTPCTTSGVCMNCDSPQRICNVGVTLWKRPRHTEYYVVLVPENLGY
ncbi:MAG: lactate utilization protein [Endomicrobiales bacterium]|nr:lactate utilization protein [Endomicrobiales bacterium]